MISDRRGIIGMPVKLTVCILVLGLMVPLVLDAVEDAEDEMSSYGILQEAESLRDAIQRAYFQDCTVTHEVDLPSGRSISVGGSDGTGYVLRLLVDGEQVGTVSLGAAQTLGDGIVISGHTTVRLNATVDADGKRCYVLTLQAREQHIRREKATSNICSNQSLMALYVTVYLSLMGPQGMKRVNDLSYGGAHYLHAELLKTGLFREAFGKPFLKEFVLHSKLPVERLQKALLDVGIFGALSCGGDLVSFCVTENRTKEEIDRVVSAVIRCHIDRCRDIVNANLK